MLHPSGGDGARAVFRVAFVREITKQENFILRPEEYGSVAVDNDRGLLYVGSRDGTLLALDQDSGEERWWKELGGAVSAPPQMVGGDGLLVGTDDGVVLFLDLDTQEVRWRQETAGTVRRAPIVHRGVVYFSNSRDEVRAVDLRTGDHVWQHSREFQRGFTIYGKAGLSFVPNEEEGAAEVGVLYSGFDDGRVVAIGATSGSALWITSLAPPGEEEFVDVDSTPVVDLEHQQIVVTGRASGVHGLSLGDGSERWSLAIKGAGAVTQGPGGLFYVTSALEGLLAIDSQGTLRWQQKLDPGTPSAALVVDESTLYMSHSESGLLAYDAASGEFLAGMQTGSGISNQPVWDPATDRLYAISNRGLLFALDLGVVAQAWP